MQGNVTEGLSRAVTSATRAQHGVQDVDDRDPCVPVTELTLDEDSVSRSLEEFQVELNSTFRIRVAKTECVFRDNWDMPSSIILNTPQGINLTFEFHLHICMYWDVESETWKQDGCRVSPLSTRNVTICQCNHLTTFASTFISVNTIDFVSVFTESNLGDNVAVFAVVIGIACLVVLLAPVMWWKDRQDLLRWAAHPLVDNSREDTYMYTVSVYTGYPKHSGTRSLVHFDLIGDLDGTRDRRLQDLEDCTRLDTGTLNHYVMSVPRSLGPLTYLHIRHDNSGEGHYASWYVYWIVVCDLQTRLRYCFVLNDWLAADSLTKEIPSRTLLLAGHEETLAVKSDFYRVVRETFADHHLWNSLFNRQLPSRFTRLQRLGVCASLLYLFMITNAMFYSLDSLEARPVCPAFRLVLGPYTLTSQQLYVGAISSLIVFPVNFLIIQIFRRARGAAETVSMNGKLVEFASRYGQAVSPPQQEGALPRWSVGIAWFLVVLSVVTGGFFVVLYSLQWGKKRSEAWLISMFMSLLESVLLVEPAKTVFVALVISCCCGRILRKTLFKNPDKFINTDEGPEKECHNGPPDIKPATWGAGSTMWWHKNINAQDIAEQIGRHLVFMVLILAIIWMYRHNDAFYMSKAVKDALLGPKPHFMKIRTFENYWEWANAVLIPTLYSNETYTGGALSDEEMMFAGEAIGLRVGSVRLRQLRVQSNLCVVANKMTDYGLDDECNVEYTTSSEDKSNHGERWQNRSLPSWMCSDSSLTCPWRFTKPPSPSTSRYLGVQGTVFSGGGFIADLGTTPRHSYRVLRYLQDADWISVQTRAVFTEFTLYNPDANYFCLVTYVIEFPPTNGAIPFPVVHTFRLYDFADETEVYSLLVTLLHLVFLLWLLRLTFIEFEHLKKARAKYFLSFNNCLEAMTIMLSAFGVIIYVIRQYAVDAFSAEIAVKKDLHFSFRTLVFLDELYALSLGTIGFLATIKLQALLCFDRRFTVMTRTLSDAKFKLLGCGVVFFIVFYGFVWINYLIIGSEQKDYSTIISTSETLLITLLGKFRFSQFDTNASSKTLVIIIFILFCVFQGFILLNMFMSIIIDSFATLRADEATYENTVYLEDVIASEIRRNVRKIIPQRVLKRWDNSRILSGRLTGAQLENSPGEWRRKLPNPSPDSCPDRCPSSRPGGIPSQQTAEDDAGAGKQKRIASHTSPEQTGQTQASDTSKPGPRSSLAMHVQGFPPDRFARSLKRGEKTSAAMDLLEKAVDRLITRVGIDVTAHPTDHSENVYIAQPDHMNLETI
ncbi:polycystic kidney disease protein 1-like 2 [Acanthaster planci]|uniref:Polycystic kidney disease protein 1-like 2 n=1 Tax=Acanthaster planci TaxID=133434 RepID=A0A8B7XFK3_ACAPL|nr:polycystic kidney disease protein 1-like 2 [Acanthaster planci]